MIMNWIWCGIVCISLLCAAMTGQGAALSAAVSEGAQKGISLGISMAGSICLWCGAGKVMEKAGITEGLSKVIRPLLHRIFPTSQTDPQLRRYLSANICANFLGLGNAATPMGIRAVCAMKDPKKAAMATDEMCRLIVLNTASIQLIPANVAAIRSSLGCATPFDILPAVWVTSVCSAGIGLMSAWAMGRWLAHG